MVRMAQRTTSAFKGSPTEHMWRTFSRSCSLTRSSPARMSMRSAVGAVYHTVTPYFSRMLYHIPASNRPSYDTIDVPRYHGPNMPYDVPVTQPGSAVHQ